MPDLYPDEALALHVPTIADLIGLEFDETLSTDDPFLTGVPFAARER